MDGECRGDGHRSAERSEQYPSDAVTLVHGGADDLAAADPADAQPPATPIDDASDGSPAGSPSAAPSRGGHRFLYRPLSVIEQWNKDYRSASD